MIDHDHHVDMTLLNNAKRGFYRNCPAKSLGEPDFMAAVGCPPDRFRRTFKDPAWVWTVAPLTYRKLLLLASPAAPHYVALFRVMEIQEEQNGNTEETRTG